MNAPLPSPQPEHAYLLRLGERVRAWRTEQGMTRKALSLASGVSERYLAQLEGGEGNISVLLLRKIARAIGVAVERLVREEEEAPRSARIALLGLRGAGKSTLGEKLARALQVPFVELDKEVEKEAGAALGEVFALYGQDAFRRFERRALELVLAEHARAVIATGGGLVTDPGTYSLLLERCRCIWLKASPEEHVARVIAQGDMRPFAGKSAGKLHGKGERHGRAAVLEEIRKLLAERDPLYGRADLVIDTSGKTIRHSFSEIRKALS